MTEEINPPRRSLQTGANIRPVRVKRIKLDSTFENEKIQVAGEAVFVHDSSGPQAYALFSFNHSDPQRLKLSKGFVMSGFPVTDIYVTNDMAQTGAWLELAISPIRQPDIDIPPHEPELAAIVGDMWRLSTLRFVGVGNVPAQGAGVHSAIRVNQPAGVNRRFRLIYFNGRAATGNVSLAQLAASATENADISAMQSLIGESNLTNNSRNISILTANLPAAEYIQVNSAAPLKSADMPWKYFADFAPSDYFYAWNSVANEAFVCELVYVVLPVTPS